MNKISFNMNEFYIFRRPLTFRSRFRKTRFCYTCPKGQKVKMSLVFNYRFKHHDILQNELIYSIRSAPTLVFSGAIEYFGLMRNVRGFFHYVPLGSRPGDMQGKRLNLIHGIRICHSLRLFFKNSLNIGNKFKKLFFLFGFYQHNTPPGGCNW